MNSRHVWIVAALILLSSALLLAMASPLLATKEEPLLENPRQLIYEGRRSGEGYFSPDGTKLVFQSEREPGNPFFQIYCLDFTTGDSIRISPGTGKTTCSFLRPGTGEVLFASTHLDPDAVKEQEEELSARAEGRERRYSWDYDEYYDLFCADPDGMRPRRLTRSRGYDAEGSYSPDGKLIVFCSMRDTYPEESLTDEERKILEVDPSYFGEIYLMNADGSGTRRLTNWKGYDGGPFFSPDGTRILWRHFEEDGARADVYTMALDGTDVRRLTDFGAMSWAPYFHPSGEYVAFASNKHGFSNFEVFLVDAKGTREPVRATHTDGFDGLPVFSPDGKGLCWTSSRAGGKGQLFVSGWNHEEALRLLESAPRREGPAVVTVAPHPKRTTVPPPPEGTPSTLPTFAKADRLLPDIRKEDLRELVDHLASDSMEGRLTGSEGTRQSSLAIASLFQNEGLLPMGQGGTFFHEFPYTSHLQVERAGCGIQATLGDETRALVLDHDFRPLSVTSNASVEGEVVFAGFGLSVPAQGNLPEYDSYAGIDVRDKIVIVLHSVPGDVDLQRRHHLTMRGSVRYKAMVARERGAKALLVVTGSGSESLLPVSVDSSLAGSGIVSASLTLEAATSILKAGGKDLAALRAALDREDPKEKGSVSLDGVRLHVRTELKRILGRDRNVLGYLPPNDGPEGKKDIIVVGAHYDHIGRGEAGGSLARKGDEGQIHNGADDNASGTALVLEMAAHLARLHRTGEVIFSRGVLFALWSGEEIGIIGSSAWLDDATVDRSRLATYVNFDMVGRLRDNRLVVQGTGSSGAWRRLLERRNILAGFQLVLEDDPYAPTDISSFYPRGIPVITFFTGSHEDYNRPTDDPDTLDYAGMERIGRFGTQVVLDLVTADQRIPYEKVEAVRPLRESRENLRAFLGTIPDYTAQDVGGVRISGVGGGGPADEAGMRGGDVIVEFGGITITNIYDYTYALEAAKVGEAVTIVVLRDGKRVPLELTPRARK